MHSKLTGEASANRLLPTRVNAQILVSWHCAAAALERRQIYRGRHERILHPLLSQALRPSEGGGEGGGNSRA